MRENRTYGSEGGGEYTAPYPYRMTHDPSVREDADTSPAKLGRSN